jgi:uncharacterized protein (TIGR03382 family)
MRNLRLTGAACAAIALSLTFNLGSAQATSLSFEATSAAGSMSFTVDTVSATTVSDPFGLSGSWYTLESLVVNGQSLANGIVGLYDNFSNGRDYLYVFTSGSFATGLQLEDADGSVLSGGGLAQLQGLTLADFNATSGNNRLRLNNADSTVTAFGAPTAAVPEPAGAAMALAGLALVGGVARRRKA